jgi:hypothetical protein
MRLGAVPGGDSFDEVQCAVRVVQEFRDVAYKVICCEDPV